MRSTMEREIGSSHKRSGLFGLRKDYFYLKDCGLGAWIAPAEIPAATLGT